MQTTFVFNKIINYYYNNNNANISNKSSFISILFNEDPNEFKTRTRTESIQKTLSINKQLIYKKHSHITNLKAIQNLYTCDPEYINPVFEIRLKYLKYVELGEEYADFFIKAQKTYQVLYRFINMLKFKKMRKFDNECDLCMVPLSSFPPKQTIWLFENGMRFHFNIRDLMKIIVSALTSSFYMFETAKLAKNPFTNSKFTVFQLNLIYTRLCELKIKIPTVIELFFRAGFDIDEFKQMNRTYLIELAIETHYAKDIDLSKERIVDVLEMVNDFCNPFMMIRFHKQFPIKIIYEIFRPYLILRARYMAFHCEDSKTKLKKALKLFHLMNPLFGHRYFDSDGNSGFDDRHIPYGDIFNCNFYGNGTMSMIDVLIQNKSKYLSVFNVGIMPIENVQYVLMKSNTDVLSTVINLSENNATQSPSEEDEEDDEDEEEDEEDEEDEDDEEDEEDEEANPDGYDSI
jgi:hypothetical protein